MAKAREKLMEEMQGSELIFSEVMPDVLVDESELDTLEKFWKKLNSKHS